MYQVGIVEAGHWEALAATPSAIGNCGVHFGAANNCQGTSILGLSHSSDSTVSLVHVDYNPVGICRSNCIILHHSE